MAGPEKQEKKDQIKVSPEDTAKKAMSLSSLEKVLKDLKVEHSDKILENVQDGRRDVVVSYHGAPILIEFDEYYHVVFFKDQLSGPHVTFEEPLNPSQLLDALACAREIPDILLEKMGVKFPPETVFTAQGISRFSFQRKNPDKTMDTYLVVSDKHGLSGRVYQYTETVFDPASGQFKRNFLTLDKTYRVEESVSDAQNFQLSFYQIRSSKPSPSLSEDRQTGASHSDSGNPMPHLAKIDFSFQEKSTRPQTVFDNVLGLGAFIAPKEKGKEQPDEIRTFQNGEVITSETTEKGSVYIAATDQTLSYSCPRIQTYKYFEDGTCMVSIDVKFPRHILDNKHISVHDKKTVLFAQNGKVLEEKNYDRSGILLNTVRYTYAKDSMTATFLVDQDKPFLSITSARRSESDPIRNSVYLHDLKGENLRDYVSEKEKNSTLTTDEYIAKLALILDTPEKWQCFIDNFFQYVTDTPDLQDPTRIGKNESMKEYLSNPKSWHRNRERDPLDYYQTPAETIRRVDPVTGKIQGDCEDIALLAKAILSKQSVKSEVVVVTRHAICTYIVRRPDGFYDAYIIDTGGFRKNGKRFYEKGDERSRVGFRTPEEAMSSIYDFYSVNDPEIRRKDNFVLALATDLDQEQRMKNRTFYLRAIGSFVNVR